MDDQALLDCVVIGAGPAGLTAALYLRRFHRDIVVLDAGESRARWIPESHNCPGFPGGVSGDDLLALLREQASGYGVPICTTRVTALQALPEGFRATDDSGHGWNARMVLLATGVVDVLPQAPWVEEAVQQGAMRICAICDGYEASDTSIAVYGPLPSAMDHGLFMRTYSDAVTVIAAGGEASGAADRQRADAAGITLLEGDYTLDFDGTRCHFVDGEGGETAFDTVYPVLGSRSQCALATSLGARVDDKRELVVSRDQMTSVAGLYAIGDVVSSLNQISVAVGHAAIAATAIHNALPANLRSDSA